MNPVEHNLATHPPAAHPVTPEEVMAFRDGELEPADAARVEAHLRDCATCQKLAEELKMVSQTMQTWAVGKSPVSLPVTSTGSIPSMDFPVRHRRGSLRRWQWALSAAAVVVILVVGALHKMKPAAPRVAGDFVVSENAPLHAPLSTPVQRTGQDKVQKQPGAPPPAGDNLWRLASPPVTPTREFKPESNGLGGRPLTSGPMVIRTVELAILAEDYAKARPTLDGILAKHGGFAAQLSASDTKGQAQSLSAILRVPADKLATVVAELKKLGRVETETHRGDEVTQQYTDLNARLSNARNTEQRLIAVLKERTGKVKDILEVEQEIARVREEIETMDAQRRTMENQVQLATIQLQIREDYKAAFQVTRPTTGTRLWNAFAGGIRDAADTVLSFILLLLNVGPTLLLWAAILFWPARVAWRRLQPMWNAQNLG